jgi:hypothetical protein
VLDNDGMPQQVRDAFTAHGLPITPPAPAAALSQLPFHSSAATPHSPLVSSVFELKEPETQLNRNVTGEDGCSSGSRSESGGGGSRRSSGSPLAQAHDKSLLKACNSQQGRVQQAVDHWSDVKMWNGMARLRHPFMPGLPVVRAARQCPLFGVHPGVMTPAVLLFLSATNPTSRTSYSSHSVHPCSGRQASTRIRWAKVLISMFEWMILDETCIIMKCHAGEVHGMSEEPWGRIICEAYTDSHSDAALLVDVAQDIAVQIFPTYPFVQRSIVQCRPVYDMRGCPTFVLWLPRDGIAHLFWKRRDLLAPYFWNSDGSPGMPPQRCYDTELLHGTRALPA